MSSPEQRRSNRSSVNGTPRRTTRSSQAPASSPSLPNDQNENAAADQQLRSEASDANMQDVTPRGATRSSQNISQSQAPPTSSPLFFRSSPNGSQSQSQNAQQSAGAGAPSSPLKRQVDAPSSDGGRTPRASGMGGMGGMLLRQRLHSLVLMRYRLLANPLCLQL
jgi:DNA replication licensing factor MCM4